MAAEYVMKLGHVGSASPMSKPNEHALSIKDPIERLSYGRIEVQIYPSSQMGTFRESLEMVQNNTLEAAMTTVGGIASFFPEFQVTDLPYHLSNEFTAEFFGQSPFWAEIGAAVLKKTGNIRWMGAGRGGYRHFITAKKQIKTAADLKGVKMRTINSDLQQEFVRALGANPTPVPWGEVYTSLSTGVVEGIKNDCSDIITFKMPVKYIILDGHVPIYDFIWVSDKWLKSLPPDLQIIVAEGIRAGCRWSDNYWKWAARTFRARFQKEMGGVITVPTEEQMATFLPAKEHMRKWFVKQYPDGEFWLKKYDAAIAATEDRVSADYKPYLEY
jgi:TRAP-type C4-dicarboxylate transport system substrate-binding protein